MDNKEKIHTQVKKDLYGKNLKIDSEDFERPWGGFFRISNESLDEFLSVYFSGVEWPFNISKLNVSPKILVVAPGKKLSWQVHERRSELWLIVKGPVGIYTSDNDAQPDEMKIYNDNEMIELKLGTRHRLVGLDDWGIIAEIWVHQFPDNPSDEEDIRRIDDDFGR
ncbi:MAG: phosphoheptose isomerase [Bacteroidota bacterium]|nr:phosphoheptose isomerase [Bacteroidota bacterium]